jgi:DNA polymerase III epsilon subunit-like protein
MYLFFDTETTGLPKSWKAPVTDLNNWPRLVQIAWIFYDKDGINIRSGNHIIKPEGFTIPADSSNIHGITTQRAEEEGIALQSALEDFQQNLSEATYLIAHNISFDEKIVGAEFLRKNITNDLSAKRKICTMESSTDFCAIDGPYGYKWPKLQELHHKLFGVGFTEAHNAAADIAATAACFWEMKKRGMIKGLTPVISSGTNQSLFD